MVNLNDLIVGANTFTITSAVAINNAGQIAAQGHNGDLINHALLLTPFVAPTPTPTPTPVPAKPVVKLSNKKPVKTAKKSLVVRGTASSTVTSVTYQVGAKRGTASGKNSWFFTASALKVGKTNVTVIAHGPGGNSAPLKFTITRTKSGK
jgi:hypothetical protein